ncbi:MAG: hypothetical protein CMH38_03520 [Microbacterium sp.]|mgnify:FL=1|uniref:hypothetical protein n=1 Tax=Microbacterium sp. TaxID=51671 RepID=UPI000C40DC61|nr:hypothetical protein [Microbacterium sp.]MAY48825.1 hypothetical protein [Microbacterium sp.]MAY48988.1 hypothetical protein [Microbacterium sp.]
MTPAAVLSAHAWNSITGKCACGGWEGNRVDHGAHQIEQLKARGWVIEPARISILCPVQDCQWVTSTPPMLHPAIEMANHLVDAHNATRQRA